MNSQTGDDILEIPLGEAFRAQMVNPYAVVHRVDMHKALLDTCLARDLVEIRTRHRVTGYKSGRINRAPLIPPTRAQMVGDEPPIVSGHTTYRSVIPKDQMPEDLRWNAATVWAGPKCHIVH